MSASTRGCVAKCDTVSPARSQRTCMGTGAVRVRVTVRYRIRIWVEVRVRERGRVRVWVRVAYLLRGVAWCTGKSLDMALTTLRKMAAGGVHDHVGGGFHRYSVDEFWHIPHFEKMMCAPPRAMHHLPPRPCLSSSYGSRSILHQSASMHAAQCSEGEMSKKQEAKKHCGAANSPHTGGLHGACLIYFVVTP